MTTIMLLLALQDVDTAAAAYARGDDSARAAIVKAGVHAMLPLRRVRAQSPARIDALAFDVKKAGADAELLRSLETRATIALVDACVGETFQRQLRDEAGLRVRLDPLLPAAAVRKFTVRVAEKPRREILDEVGRAAGLDWGFFYGGILLSTPERLWPTAGPARDEPLKPEQVAHARRCIERFDSESVEDRDAASAELRRLGRAVIPLLEENAGRPQAEVASRCRALLAELKAPPPRAVFGPPAAESQGGADAAAYRDFKERLTSFRVRDINVQACLKLLFGANGLDASLPDSLRPFRVTVTHEQEPMWALAALLCHACDHDFIFRDGRIVVAPREEIGKLTER